ncbi:MAG: TrmH family RNA methyltransferase [Gammaproteobacteria bacterium]
MSQSPITLVGDGIENPWNARAMLHAAGMFSSSCHFRDGCDLARAWAETFPLDHPLPVIGHGELARDYSPILALDNLEGAKSIYGLEIGRGPRPAVIVGNERRGVAKDIAPICTDTAEIPMVSRRLNCLNVAAASSGPAGASTARSAQPARATLRPLAQAVEQRPGRNDLPPRTGELLSLGR